MNLSQVEGVCHELEGVLARAKERELAFSTPVYDLFYKTVDLLRGLLTGPDRETAVRQMPAMARALKSLASRKLPPAAAIPPPPPPPPPPRSLTAPAPPASLEDKAALPDTIRISASKLDGILFQVEELLAGGLAQTQRANELFKLLRRFSRWHRQWTGIAPEIRGLRRQIESAERGEPRLAESRRLLEYLDWHQQFLRQFERDCGAVARALGQNEHQLKSGLNLLLDGAKEALTLPFSELFQSFARMVRDFSHDERKDVDLALRGAEIEIDRRILEAMKDPFIHLIRNSLGHGIESPAERQSKGKSPRVRFPFRLPSKVPVIFPFWWRTTARALIPGA